VLSGWQELAGRSSANLYMAPKPSNIHQISIQVCYVLVAASKPKDAECREQRDPSKGAPVIVWA
jgi:hypothetical protein